MGLVGEMGLVGVMDDLNDNVPIDERIVHALDAIVPALFPRGVLDHAEAGGQLQSMLVDFHRLLADGRAQPLG
jgi:hypothetical protein